MIRPAWSKIEGGMTHHLVRFHPPSQSPIWYDEITTNHRWESNDSWYWKRKCLGKWSLVYSIRDPSLWPQPVQWYARKRMEEVENHSECDKIYLFQSENSLDHSYFNWVGFLNRIHMEKFLNRIPRTLYLPHQHIATWEFWKTRESTLEASVSVLLCSNYNNLL